jgi:hypothetical protein
MPKTFTDHNEQNKQPAPFISYREIPPALLFTDAVLNAVHKISQTNLPLLITGEKGLGQSHLSLRAHESGFTKGQPFLEISLQPAREQDALDNLYALLSAEVSREPFRGTLHINNLEHASFQLQSALLHVLEEQRLRAGNKHIRFQGRIAASIDNDLDKMATQGTILQELMHKLLIAPIQLKSLRERQKDIPLFAALFSSAATQRIPGPSKQFSEDAIRCLEEHSWPGNLPELESVIYRSVYFAQSQKIERQNILFAPALPEQLQEKPPCTNNTESVPMQQEHSSLSVAIAPLDLSIAHLVAELSHEIKNPLVAVKTFIQLFPAHMNDPEFLSEFFSIAEKSTDRIDYLTERMLEFAKLSEPRFVNVSLVSVLREILKNLDAAGAKLQAEWSQQIFEQLCAVRADFEQLRYALENILLHIAHNIKDGGQVKIASEESASAASVKFSYASDKYVQGLAFHNAKGDRISDLNGLDLFLAQQVLQINLISCTKHHANGHTIITIQLSRVLTTQGEI